MTTKLRPATAADRDLILTWRNHPRVREASFNTDIITRQQHASWFADVLADPKRPLYICEYNGEAVGVVHYDLRADNKTGTWSHYLDIESLDAKHALLTAWLELCKIAVTHAFTELDLTRLDGETMSWNKPIIAINKRLGATTTQYQKTIDGHTFDVCAVSINATEARI